MNTVIRGAVAAALLGLCAGAYAENLTAAELAFVQKAAAGGMAEVELGKLAQQKAQNDQVKQFGARMEQDHAKANDELKKLASAKGLALPGGTDRAHQKEIDRLGALSGETFDREYMKHMVKDHQEDVMAFRKQARAAKDAELKGFASKTLPTLQEHLKLAQATDSAVSGKGASKP